MKIGKRWFFVTTDAKLAEKIEAVLNGTAFVHKQRRAKIKPEEEQRKFNPAEEQLKNTAYNIQEEMKKTYEGGSDGR
jgi:hypothetical protein